MDVTGLPMAAVVVPASAHENVATAVLMDQLSAADCADRLEVLLVDRGTSVGAAASIGKAHGIEVRRIGWDDKRTSLPSYRTCVAGGSSARLSQGARSVSFAAPAAKQAGPAG